MKSYFLVPIVFIMSLLSSCQELGNPYTDSVSVKSIQVDTCYYSSKNDCIWYGLNVQIDKFVSPYSFVEFVFEIGNKSYYVGSDSSLDGEFYLLLNLPVSEYTFDYVANIASTGRCYVYVSGFEYAGRYEYGKFKYTLPSFGAILPKGSTFNSKVNEFIAQNGGITEIAFITNSPIKSDDELVRDDVYMVKNQNVLEIHTLSDSFVVNEDASDMFRSMGGIQAIDFGESFNTQNVTDMNVMFCGCTSLTSLDVSNFNTQNVTSMYSMFYDCSSLTSLDVSNFNTQNVTSMYSMFYNCSSLTSLDVSNLNTQNVTDMRYMFGNCSSLTSLDVSNFNTQNVTSMYSMFYKCSSLTSLDVSNFNTQNVTDMSYMFSNCSSLTSLDVSNFDTQNVTDMGRMFLGCSSLTSLDLSNFDTHNVTDMTEMFRDCSSLTSLDVSKFTFESNPDIGSMFLSTGSNATNKPIPIYVSAEGKSYIESEGNSSINSNYATLTDKETFKEGAFLPDGETFNSIVDAFMTGKGITGIKFIINSAAISEDALVDGSIYLVQNGQTLEIHTAADQFVANSSCYMMFDAYKGYDNSTGIIYNSFGQIQTIDFGENFNTQNVTYMNGMFYYCTRLTSLDVSNFNTQNVTDMCGMFEGCSSLTSLDVGNFDTRNVTDMSTMFVGCSNLTSLDVSKFDTQNVTDMWRMFEYCSSLTSLDVSNFNTQNVTYMNGMFYYCTRLTSLDLSNFTFESNPYIGSMFYNTGVKATNKPIPIYVSADGKSYIETKGNSSINSSYATLIIKTP